MRKFAIAAMLAAIGLTTAQAQPAPTTGAVCLRLSDSPADAIDHTHVVDPTTILFYMRDGKVWKNTLAQPCPGLMLHGFAFKTSHDELCSNRQGIEIIETHQVCVLGTFVRYVPPPPSQ